MSTATFGEHDLRLVVLNDAIVLDEPLIVDLVPTVRILILLDAGQLTADTGCVLGAFGAIGADHALLAAHEHLFGGFLGRLAHLLIGIIS